MKSVTELYGRYPDSDIYVVGTGTSLRVFPLDFLENKITIGLNLAWKACPVKYGITIVPEWNIPEFMEDEQPHSNITWITRANKVRVLKASSESLDFAEANYYSFDSKGKNAVYIPNEPLETGRMLDWVRTPTPDKLYLWSSISQSAVNLAANMGAKNIILIGCDNCAIDDNQHAVQQHSCWQGIDQNRRYMEYYEGLAEVRAVLRERNVNVLNLSALLKLDDPKLDFYRLCDELDKQKTVAPSQERVRKQQLDKLNEGYIRLTKYLISENFKALGKKFRLTQS